MTPDFSVAALPSPIGLLTVVVSDTGVRAVWWEDDPRPGADPTDGESMTRAGAARHRLLEATICQLEEYFAGARTDFDLPLDPQGTAFQHQAWEVLRTIPYASTMTYREQAEALGDPNKARAVGAANGRNPIGIIVPCHRVVATSGALTGFAGGLSTKAWLLEHERRVAAGG